MAEQPRGRHVRQLLNDSRDAYQADAAGRLTKAAEIRATIPYLEALASAYETADQDAAVQAMKRVYPFAIEIVFAMDLARRLVGRERGHDAREN